MRLLLDTHIFLWCVLDSPKLTEKARSLIEHAEEKYVSSASIWEIAIKKSLGKLDVDVKQLVEAITLSGFSELPIQVQHAAEVSSLPNLHRDPFDRLLIAQALSEPLVFLTADVFLKNYSQLIEIV